MLTHGLLAAIALGAIQDGDTTFAARSARTLDVEVQAAVIVVRGWDRDEVRVQTDRRARRALEIEHRGQRVSIESDIVSMAGRSAEIEIDVPVHFNISVEGLSVEVHVQDTEGWVDVESLNGDVSVIGSVGDVKVETMAGAVLIEDSRGDLDLQTAGHGVEVIGARGDIEIETVGGPIEVSDINSLHVDLSSLGGRIHFAGAFQGGGSYTFESHGGGIDLDLSPGADATIEMDTHHGEIESEYPGLRLVRGRDGTRTFIVGDGRAEVEIETFSGRVRVRERSR